MLCPLQTLILTKLVDAGGEVTVAQLDKMYDKGQGWKIAGLNRRRLTEWIRPEHGRSFNAIGLRITDEGRAALARDAYVPHLNDDQ